MIRNTKIIRQSEPWFSGSEAEAVNEYFQSSGWLTEYKKTTELENMIADYVGSRHCVMFPNGTLAMYAATMSLGIGEGDRVLVPDLTMIATANAVRMTGAEPVFVDISEDNLCMNMDKVEKYYHYVDFRGIIVVSLNGRAPDMRKVKFWADRHGVFFIEDACQAMGSKQSGKYLGTFGHCGVFSFSPHKIITTGQGGCVVTDDDSLASSLRLFKDFGRSCGGHDDYRYFGTNLKFTDLQAVVGIEQMKSIDSRTVWKKRIFSNYVRRLKDVPEVRFVETDLLNTVPWFVDAFVQSRDELASFLKEKGIATRPMYPPLRRTPVYDIQSGGDIWVSDIMSANGLWLPSSLSLTDLQIKEVCDAIVEYYGS